MALNKCIKYQRKKTEICIHNCLEPTSYENCKILRVMVLLL